MTRYFYRHAVEATLMATKYGLRFDIVREDGTMDRTDPVDADALAGNAPSSWTGRRFFLRPEGLALLNPRLGDLVECDGCFYFVVTAEEHQQAEHVAALRNQTVAITVVKSWPGPGTTFIRMRDGQAFLHPEREDA